MNEALKDHNAILEYVESAKQVGDIFTKDLAPIKFLPAVKMLGIDTGDEARSSCRPQRSMESRVASARRRTVTWSRVMFLHRTLSAQQ